MRLNIIVFQNRYNNLPDDTLVRSVFGKPLTPADLYGKTYTKEA